MEYYMYYLFGYLYKPAKVIQSLVDYKKELDAQVDQWWDDRSFLVKFLFNKTKVWQNILVVVIFGLIIFVLANMSTIFKNLFK